MIFVHQFLELIRINTDYKKIPKIDGEPSQKARQGFTDTYKKACKNQGVDVFYRRI